MECSPTNISYTRILKPVLSVKDERKNTKESLYEFSFNKERVYTYRLFLNLILIDKRRKILVFEIDRNLNRIFENDIRNFGFRMPEFGPSTVLAIRQYCVFDLIIPIVDYTNFAIMGITCAVAWELPSKPPSEIIENFRTKLNDGTFGLSRRNDSTQQQLKYINSQRTEQEVVEDNKKWKEGTAGIYNQNYPQYQQHQQLSATVATISGHEQFLTNAAKPPFPLPQSPSSSSSNLHYNNYRQREKFQQPPTSTTFFYSQHPQQQQQWHNYNFKTFDSNQRKTFYANDNRERPIYRNDFASQANKNNYYQAHLPTNQWNAENWQATKQQTKFPYNDADAGDYWNKDNWWERNKNRIEKHWQENQQKWSQYQENPHSYQTPMFSKRTGRNRKILNKPPKHRIYPIFGKRRRRRSTADHRAHLHNDNLTKILQDIHTREHLQTRQKLYGKIEKLYKTCGHGVIDVNTVVNNSHMCNSYIPQKLTHIYDFYILFRLFFFFFANPVDRRGQNGTACVLRALCETEKMHAYGHYNERPQSFVMELLRSIFALPKDTLTNSKDSSLHLHSRYTDAVLRAHDVTQSCSQQYYDFYDAVPTLRRKRRYLEFPEGSSFQLVYDLIIGVVDYTNYLILGVTVALAWELPSKPPSEIFEDLTERLRDGTLGTSRNDTVKNIKYINLKTKTPITKTSSTKYEYKLQPIFSPPMHYRYYTHATPNSFYKYQNNKGSQNLNFYTTNRYNNWSRKDNQYYTPKQGHPFTKWTQYQTGPTYNTNSLKYPWWNLSQRLKNSFISHPSVRNQNINRSTAHINYKKPIRNYKPFPSSGRSEHRIYPVFGKRSIFVARKENEEKTSSRQRFKRSGIVADLPSKLDRIHIEQHRKTRHDLYQRIEIYLNGRGSHGHHCVLRALCETGQKSKEHKPGSFVGELMRAIFTMPEPVDATTDTHHRIGYKEQRYDTANALKENCTRSYNLCKDSLWSSHFVL
ncbi:hypothetical protein FF38_03979 [Lucilia cuprina]|uniref:Uncharacterized protein n=1 Tax=Lucilia cuprina TaxID=7375 RepID=A0A0L0BP19_LUCCU|nr:hypothetical protein FF38_03979 [Lucilia cuprina]